MVISKKTIIFQDSKGSPTFPRGGRWGTFAFSYRTCDFPWGGGGGSGPPVPLWICTWVMYKWGPPRGCHLWATWEKRHLFQGNKGQILRGRGEHIGKQIFDLGNSGEQESRGVARGFIMLKPTKKNVEIRDIRPSYFTSNIVNIVNNKGADQTAWASRLVCALVVCKQISQDFLHRGSQWCWSIEFLPHPGKPHV